MKYKNLIIFFFSFFILVFKVNADPTEEFNKKVKEKYNEIIGLYPFQERRNDIGVFYDFAWNKEKKIISIKRDNQNYPIVRFSLFNKDMQQGVSVKKYNDINLSDSSDEEIKKMHSQKADAKLTLKDNKIIFVNYT